ncbi:MAG: hypothetical protein L0Y37_00675 [Bacteroidales bacterium]|nr:hypothetical protein [Bacteroidales bacterium]
MNIIKHTLLLLSVGLSLMASTASCSKDEETDLIPRDAAYFKAELTQLCNEQLPVVDACVVGYGLNQFKPASQSNFTKHTTAYRNALNNVLTVVNKPDVTLSELIASSKTLGKPGEDFRNNTWISDRQPLHDLIVECETLNAATIVGTDPGQVPQQAKTDFTAAITGAKKTRDAATTIDRQVDEGVDKLGDAKTAFEAAIIK